MMGISSCRMMCPLWRNRREARELSIISVMGKGVVGGLESLPQYGYGCNEDHPGLTTGRLVSRWS